MLQSVWFVNPTYKYCPAVFEIEAGGPGHSAGGSGLLSAPLTLACQQLCPCASRRRLRQQKDGSKEPQEGVNSIVNTPAEQKARR